MLGLLALFCSCGSPVPGLVVLSISIARAVRAFFWALVPSRALVLAFLGPAIHSYPCWCSLRLHACGAVSLFSSGDKSASRAGHSAWLMAPSACWLHSMALDHLPTRRVADVVSVLSAFFWIWHAT